MKKTIAVVVSCNRHEALKSCIEQIRNQSHPVHQILVVNNGSSDYSTVWLDQQDDLIHIYQDNLGPAGGFHTGIDWAHKNGYTWIWCMEDDSTPQFNTLEMLFQHQDEKLALYNSVVVDANDHESLVYQTAGKKYVSGIKESVLEGYAHPFNGCLIHREIVDRAGLPNAKLFYWGEGSDYFYRITKKCGIPARTILSSIHIHPSQSTDLSVDWNLGTSWKMYFFIRNRYAVFNSKYNNRLFASILYSLFILKCFSSIFIYQKTDRLKKWKFIFWPLLDVIAGKYEHNNKSVQQKLALQIRDSFISLIFRSCKNFLLDILVPSHREIKTSPSIRYTSTSI